MAQRIRNHQPKQGTWVLSLVREDAKEQLNLCATTAEPARLQLPKPMYHNAELPLLATTRENPSAAMKAQCNKK